MTAEFSTKSTNTVIRDPQPHPEGTYRVLEESVIVDRYKRIAFQRALQLERIEEES